MLTVTPRSRRRIPHGLAAAAAVLLVSAMLWHASADNLMADDTRKALENTEPSHYSVLLDLGLMVLGR